MDLILRPDVDRTTKPDHFLSTGVTSANKYGLKDVLVPRDIVVKFLNVAQTNTNRNVETCGILSGKMVAALFFILFSVTYNYENGCDN